MEGTRVIKSDGPEQVMAMPFTEMGRLREKEEWAEKPDSLW